MAESIIREKISYSSYLKLIMDFENLKNLLLNNEQRILFDIISKPKLSMKNRSILENRNDIFILQNIRQLFKYLDRLN